jgi:teichuronic acid biosynthesis glycosyltransferase TuaG
MSSYHVLRLSRQDRDRSARNLRQLTGRPIFDKSFVECYTMSEIGPRSIPPLVSAVIPTYNGAHCIRDTIDSALGQTFTDLEVVVVDDGSTDETPHILASYGERINVVRKVNGGIASARNAGIEAASGTWIALLDHDDLWDADKIQRQVAYLTDHPNVAMVYSRARVKRELEPANGCEELTGLPLPTGYRPHDGFLMRNPVPPLTALFRRDIVLGLGAFSQDASPADDWDLWLRMSERHCVGFMPEVLATYRLHGRNFHLRNLRHAIQAGERVFRARLPRVENRSVACEARFQHYCWAAPAWALAGDAPRALGLLLRVWALGHVRRDAFLCTWRVVREIGHRCLGTVPGPHRR